MIAKIKRPYFTLNINYRKGNEADEAVIREMFIENVYKIEGYQLVQDRPIVLDVGANIGTFTMQVLSVAYENNKAITVYAVEPEKNNLKLLKQNLEENKVLFSKGSTVEIIEIGISDFTGITGVTNSAGGSRLADENKLQQIRVVTYDDLLEDLAVDKIDFVKIDIEGSEVPLIKAASQKSINTGHFYAIEFDRFSEVDGFLDIMRPFMHDFSFMTWGIPINGCNVYFENHHWTQDVN